MEAGGLDPEPGGGRGLLPALTTFVGRSAEVDEVASLLGRYRLVTVTGPGGVGKTRLAAEVAARVAARFADGIRLAELASVQDQAQVPAAVAAVLAARQAPGVPALELLADVLTRQQVLLVLDNCEHVIDAVAQLCEAILPLADDIRVLATSREPIAVAGEARYRLGPLAVPGAGPDGPGASAAVELFADRASRVDSDFALDDTTAPVIGQVVARLDGMPLAIELAAARVEALGLAQLADRLDDRFTLLTGGTRTAPARQRSLAATVDWSYQLLTDLEKQMFRRLAIFSGSFTLDAAGTVTGAAGPAILKLVDCSLIAPPRTGPDGRVRYLMLETLRAFGLDRLTEAGERPGAEALLAQHMLAVAEQAAAGMAASSTEVQAATWLDAEDATMHQALVWALDHDPGTALRMAVALAPWWMLRGRRLGEGYAWLRAAVGRVPPGDDPAWCAGQVLLGEITQDLREALGYFTAVRDAIGRQGASSVLVDALAGRSVYLLNMGRVPEAQQEAHDVLAMARGLGYPAGEMVALTALGMAARYLGDMEQAVEWHRQASQIDPAQVPGRRARECAVPWVQILMTAGQVTAARRACADGLARARTAGDLTNRMICLRAAADLDLRTGHVAEAGQYLAEAIELGLRNGFRFILTSCLDTCGHLCAASGRWAEALTLWAALGVFMDGGSIGDLPEDLRRRQQARQQAAGALTGDRIRAAEERGAAMTLDTAAEYALVITTIPRQEPAQAPPELTRLSAREQELISLVARGSTDAQIATQLYISISTVRSHLDRIRDKTGCRRRADLTRLALQAGLV